MLSVVLVILALIACAQSYNGPHPIFADFDALSEEFIDHINSLDTSWKAGQNFPGKKEEDVRHLCGTLEPELNDSLEADIDDDPPTIDYDALPASFDARTRWPKCNSSISTISDQDNCGNCWAFGSAFAINDRYCINNMGTLQLSVQYITSCCARAYRYNGCGGAKISTAYACWQKYGIPTGGQFGSNYGCQPYTIKDCPRGNGNNDVTFSGCTVNKETSDTPPCSECCDAGYPKQLNDDRHFAKSYYQLKSNNAPAIQAEIYAHGPVTLTFYVYQDFMNYKSGVYKYTSGKYIGKHAVKIIGWGLEDCLPYWLAVNSWGPQWGDNGFFKILRGSNNCKIESYGMAGIPKS